LYIILSMVNNCIEALTDNTKKIKNKYTLSWSGKSDVNKNNFV